MFTIIYFDRQEYQNRPWFFQDRDAGVIYAFETRKEAEREIVAYDGTLYKAEVVDTNRLPFKVANLSQVRRGVK